MKYKRYETVTQLLSHTVNKVIGVGFYFTKTKRRRNKMKLIKLYVGQHPEDPFLHDQRLKELFTAAKWSAEMWNSPCKRPPLPEWCEYHDSYTLEDVGERIFSKDNFVLYYTKSLKGIYFFTPTGFYFYGTWRSLLDGCPVFTIIPIGPPAPSREDGLRYAEDQPPVTPKNIVRADVCVYAPIGRYGLQAYYGEFCYPQVLQEYVKDFELKMYEIIDSLTEGGEQK